MKKIIAALAAIPAVLALVLGTALPAQAAPDPQRTSVHITQGESEATQGNLVITNSGATDATVTLVILNADGTVDSTQEIFLESDGGGWVLVPYDSDDARATLYDAGTGKRLASTRIL